METDHSHDTRFELEERKTPAGRTNASSSLAPRSQDRQSLVPHPDFAHLQFWTAVISSGTPFCGFVPSVPSARGNVIRGGGSGGICTRWLLQSVINIPDVQHDITSVFREVMSSFVSLGNV